MSLKRKTKTSLSKTTSFLKRERFTLQVSLPILTINFPVFLDLPFVDLYPYIGSRVPVRVARNGDPNNGRRSRREQFMYSKMKNMGMSHKDYLKQKIQSKCMEDRNNYTKKMFETPSGKSLLQAIKKRALKYAQDGEKDESKIGQKIVSKLINSKNGQNNEVSSVLKMCKVLKGNPFFAPKSSSFSIEKRSRAANSGSLTLESRADASNIVKLKEGINSKMRKIKRMQDEVIFPDSEEEGSQKQDVEDLDEYDSISDQDEQEESGNISASIDSSELESMDSNSDSETFKDMIESMNCQYKRRIDKLVTYMTKRVENSSSEDSESETKPSLGNRFEDHFGNFSFIRGVKDIKQELGESRKKRDMKNKVKQEEQEQEQPQQTFVKRDSARTQKLSKYMSSYFYSKMRQGNSESEDSEDSASKSKIKEEEAEEEFSQEISSPEATFLQVLNNIKRRSNKF